MTTASAASLAPAVAAAPFASGTRPNPRGSSAIALHARETEGFDARVEHATQVLREAALAHGERLLQASSLGAEGMVVTDLIARAGLRIAVGTVDTGLLHAETLALLPRIRERYGIEVLVVRPEPASVLRFVRRHGERAMRESVEGRQRCCGLRKVEPFERLLAGRDGWITGMRREQSAERGAVAFSGRDAAGRTKWNPLADWRWSDVWHYIALHDVPYNPLHDAFMPSVGCAPCTRALAVGEDFRDGRWWWERSGGAKECGINASSLSPLSSTVPVSRPFEPVAEPSPRLRKAEAPSDDDRSGPVEKACA